MFGEDQIGWSGANSIRITDSKSARVSNRQRMSESRRRQPRAEKNVSTAHASYEGSERREPSAERAPLGVVVDDHGEATGPHHPVQLAQPRLATRPEEVRPPRMRRCRPSGRATGRACADPCRTSTFGVRRDPALRSRQRGRHAARPRSPARPRQRTEGGGSRCRSRCRGCQRRPTGVRRRISASMHAVGIRGLVLQLVDGRVLPDVRRRGGAVELIRAKESDADDAVGRGEARRNDAGRAVGCDPFDVQVVERVVGRAAEPLRDPVGVAGDLQPGEGDSVHSTRWTGDARDRSPTGRRRAAAGRTASPLTPSWRQRSSKPSGRCRLPCTDSRSSRASIGAMSSTAMTQPSQPPPASDRARTA